LANAAAGSAKNMRPKRENRRSYGGLSILALARLTALLTIGAPALATDAAAYVGTDALRFVVRA